jgi:hypothetical protein
MTLPTTALLDEKALAATVESIRALQLADGMIPWFEGGHCDPWNHVESAMALAVGGEHAAAERAYEWLIATQHADGSWFNYYLPGGAIEDRRLDTNVCAYLATGVWHHFVITKDAGYLEELWPVVERAIEFVLAWQRPGGELTWSLDPDGTPQGYALLTGSSSAYFSLRCAIACAEQLGKERPGWELAAGRLRHAVAFRPEAFEPKHEFAMDWYYPVLSGALDAASGAERIDERWGEFVIEHRGVRCVAHRPWVTAAETAECVLALLALDRREQATTLLAWVQQQRCDDGSYTTGVVYPERHTFPHEERSSYTAAAMVLAADALWPISPASDLFTGALLPWGLDLDSEALEDRT